MRRIFRIAIGTAVLVTIGTFLGCQMNGTSGGPAKGSGYTGGTTAGVSISDFTFDPSPLSFPQSKGVTVTWTNNESGVTHTVTFDNGSGITFDSGDVAPGMTASFTATGIAAGSYGYHCRIHPSMTGTITITNN